jgi:hypothetical protein
MKLKITLCLFLALAIISCKDENEFNSQEEKQINQEAFTDLKLTSKIIRANAKLERVNERIATMTLSEYEKPIIDKIAIDKPIDWKNDYRETMTRLKLDESQPYISKIVDKSNLVLRPEKVLDVRKSLQNYDFEAIINANSNRTILNNEISYLIDEMNSVAIIESSKIIESETFDNNSFRRKLEIALTNFEDKIEASNLSLSDKEEIFTTTSTISINLPDILDQTTSLTEITASDNIASRSAGKFWKKIGKFLKRAAATVVYVAAIAAGTFGGLMGGFVACGPYCAAAGGVGGLVLGHYVGLKLAFLISNEGPF